MNFYQAMQLGANNLKPVIKKTEDKKVKQKYITAFILIYCVVDVKTWSKNLVLILVC